MFFLCVEWLNKKAHSNSSGLCAFLRGVVTYLVFFLHAYFAFSVFAIFAVRIHAGAMFAMFAMLIFAMNMITSIIFFATAAAPAF